MANNTPATSWMDNGDPQNGTYFLVRAANSTCAAGTWNDGSASQIGSRDAELAASPIACP